MNKLLNLRINSNKLMNYIQLKSFIISDNIILVREMLTFELCQIGFESFTGASEGLIAYCRKDLFNESSIQQIRFHQDLNLGDIHFTWIEIAEQNWNLEWENNFSPVMIADTCFIRAPFHEQHNPQKSILS